MYLYLGIVFLIHSSFGLIEYRKFKLKNSEKYSIPKDILIEFLLGLFLLTFYLISRFTLLKNIYHENKPETK